MPVGSQMSAEPGCTSGLQGLPSFSLYTHSGCGHSTSVVAELIFWSQTLVANVSLGIPNTKKS